MVKIEFEVVVLFFIFLNFAQTAIYPLLFPYLVSNLKYKDPSITFKQCYLTFFFCYLSLTLCNKMQEHFYELLGIKNTIRLGAIIHVCWVFAYLYVANIYLFYLQAFILGILTTMGFQIPLVFLRTVYPEHGLKYYGCIMCAPMLGIVVFTSFASWLVNPNDEGMTNWIGDESYYSTRICQNLVYLFYAYGFGSAFVILLLVCFIKNPDIYRGTLNVWVHRQLGRLFSGCWGNAKGDQPENGSSIEFLYHKESHQYLKENEAINNVSVEPKNKETATIAISDKQGKGKIEKLKTASFEQKDAAIDGDSRHVLKTKLF